MNVSGKVPHTVDRLKELLKKLGLLYLDNAKLTVTEKLTELVSAGVMLIVTLVLGIFGIAFLSGACIELLALMLPVWACYGRCVFDSYRGACASEEKNCC